MSQQELSVVVSAIREWGRVDGKQVWQIAVEPRCFSPGSTGTLEARSRSGAVLTVEVTRVETDATGEAWLTVSRPLQEETPVLARVISAAADGHV